MNHKGGHNMTRYLFRNVLVYGSDPCRGEKLAACVYLLALYVLVWLA